MLDKCIIKLIYLCYSKKNFSRKKQNYKCLSTTIYKSKVNTHDNQDLMKKSIKTRSRHCTYELIKTKLSNLLKCSDILTYTRGIINIYIKMST